MASDAQGSGAGRVSVVIPAHNRARLLRDTLRSIAEQDEPVAEVIVADDGSTDDTAAVIEEFGAVHVSNPAGGWGPAAARNAGLEHVRTEYVAFLDSDDLLLPNAVRVLRDALEKHPGVPFAFGRGLSAFRTEAGWVPDGLIGMSTREQENVRAALFVRNSVPSPGAIVRTDAARAVGGYDPAVLWSEDHHFWIRLAEHVDPLHVEHLVSIYRRHGGNRYTPAIGQGDGMTMLDLASGHPELEARISERLGVELCEIVMSSLRASRPDHAVRAAKRLISHSPRPLHTVRRAGAHQRTRRVWWDAGNMLWAADGQLRAWLTKY
jgi:glycosyltransferase involved in cell wall biosynthesis